MKLVVCAGGDRNEFELRIFLEFDFFTLNRIIEKKGESLSDLQHENVINDMSTTWQAGQQYTTPCTLPLCHTATLQGYRACRTAASLLIQEFSHRKQNLVPLPAELLMDLSSDPGLEVDSSIETTLSCDYEQTIYLLISNVYDISYLH